MAVCSDSHSSFIHGRFVGRALSLVQFSHLNIISATLCFFNFYSFSTLHLLIEFFRKGFEDDRIEALLHKIEIQMKHQSTSFGLALTSVCDFSTALVLFLSVFTFVISAP
jgi:hypothetical protein